MGIWGLGIGDWGLGSWANPQTPIPNPQSPIPIILFLPKNKIIMIYIIYFLYIIKNKLYN